PAPGPWTRATASSWFGREADGVLLGSCLPFLLRGHQTNGVNRLTTPRHAARGIGAVQHVAGQLATGSVDVVSARLANGGDNAAFVEQLAEALHHGARRAAQAGIGEG